MFAKRETGVSMTEEQKQELVDLIRLTAAGTEAEVATMGKTISKRLRVIETRLSALEADMAEVKDSVQTIRQTMTDDFRPALDGLKRGMHLRVVPGE